jgi:N-acyl-D-amino-acid deacylase
MLIRNVKIADGTGSPLVEGSLRIQDGFVEGIGDLKPIEGENIYEAGGLTLAPGFIDTHSHADLDCFEHRDALAVVSQGITTVVVGQDGFSQFPLAHFFSRLLANPIAVNVASYTGHNTLRTKVLGDDSLRLAARSEVEDMSRLLSTEMEAGALGLSTGLEYEPGNHSSIEEVLEMASAAAGMGGRYISHIRSEDRHLEEALEEIIRIGKVTGMPIQVSHFKLAIQSLWRQAGRFLRRFDEARDEGIDITADVYPYEYWQSLLSILLPSGYRTWCFPASLRSPPTWGRL